MWVGVWPLESIKFQVDQGDQQMVFRRVGDAILISAYYDEGCAGADCEITLAEFLRRMEFSREEVEVAARQLTKK
jgi:hypothetical protein